MTIPASQDPSLGFVPGDHAGAFYSGSRNVLDDSVVDYVTEGLAGGSRVCCINGIAFGNPHYQADQLPG